MNPSRWASCLCGKAASFLAEHMPLLDNIDLDMASKKPLLKMAGNMNVPVLFAPEKNCLTLAGALKSYAAEFILVACWPYLLPEAICLTASKAALNLHPSLLPGYRGVNPVEAQLRSGEKQFGVSLHLLNQTFDSGDIVNQSRVEIEDNKLTVEEIEKQTARAGSNMFVRALDVYGSSQWQPYKQIGSESGSAV